MTPKGQPAIQKIRVLIAEDHLIARAGVTGVINMQPDMAVIAEATSGEQAVEMFRKHLPDITLLDIRMPKMSGLDAARVIRADYPDARLIALTSYEGEEDIRCALEVGVQAYLTKDVLREELVRAIHAVHAGKTYLPPKIAAAMAERSNHQQLSAREMDVLKLIARGLGNRQIAFQLDIAEDTAKNHVKSIYSKLGVQDRVQATTLAIQRGLIHLSSSE
jgi:two-component system NarL family response regulator